MTAHQAKRILLLDDDPSIVELLRLLLMEAGYEVATASNGLEGVEMLSRGAPDVVITDVVMPKMGGYEFCEYVAKTPEYEKLPVVVLSSSIIDDEELDRAFGAGATAVLPKIGPKSESMAARLLDTLKDILDPEAKPGSAPSNARAFEEHSPESLKQLVRELLDHKMWHDKIIRNISKGLLLIDGDRKIFYANHLGLELLQSYLKDLVGTDFSDIGIIQGKGLAKRLLEQIAASAEGDCLSLIAPIGDRLLSFELTGLFDERKAFLGIVATLEEYPLILELEKVRKEMHHNLHERVSDIEDSIRNLLDMVQNEPGDLPRDAFLPLIESASQELSQISDVSQYLNYTVQIFSRGNRIDRKPLSLATVLSNLDRLVRLDADRKGINILLAKVAEDTQVLVDAPSIQSSMFIILDWLVKLASPLSDLETSSKSEHGFAVSKLRVHLSRESQEKLSEGHDPFARFYEDGATLRPSASKLCVVRDLIELQGGTISFWQDKEHGEVKVALPLVPKTVSGRISATSNGKPLDSKAGALLVARPAEARPFPFEQALAKVGLQSYPVASLSDVKRFADDLENVRGVFLDLFDDSVESIRLLHEMSENLWTRDLPVLLGGMAENSDGTLKLLIDQMYAFPPNYPKIFGDVQATVGESSADALKRVLLANAGREMAETLDMILANADYETTRDVSVEEALNRRAHEADALVVDASLIGVENGEMVRHALITLSHSQRLPVFLVNTFNDRMTASVRPLTRLELGKDSLSIEELASEIVSSLSSLSGGRH